MRISEIASALAESPTLKLNAIANALKERGEPVIHLGGGEPRSPAPIDAITAAAAKLATAEIKYTPTSGIMPLKKAIVRYTEENYGYTIAPENVLVSAGAKAALYALLVSICDPQDEVIIIAPYWVSYPEMIRLVRARPVVVQSDPETFIPRIEDIEAAITPNTRAVIVNSPNNPSGVVAPESFIRAIVGLCEDKGLWLIMDDIYHRLVFDGHVAPSCYRYARYQLEESQLVVINGVSKLYGMTGFRIGWAIGPRPLIKAMDNVQAQTTSCPSALLQAAAVGALTGDQTCVEDLRTALKANRDVMLRELSTIPGVRVVRPGGTFYCLPDFRHYGKSSVELSTLLLEKALVVAVPGNEFGMDGYLRLSYCGSTRDVIEGVARIRWVLDPNAPKECYIGDRKVVRDWL